MKLYVKLLILLSVGITVLSANTGDLYSKIAQMKKGTDGYFVGETLTKEQKKIASENALQKTNPKIIKFLDGEDLLIAVDASNFRVLAINKRFKEVSQDTIKGLIGNMIHDYDEPTAMAHNKMIYWVFDKKGKKLSEDDLDAWKDQISGKSTEGMVLAEAVNIKKEKIEFNPFVSVKLQSDQPMMGEQEESKLANAYLMISSDKLIRSVASAK